MEEFCYPEFLVALHEWTWHYLWAMTDYILTSKWMVLLVHWIHVVLIYFGVPPPHPTAEQVGLCLGATISTLIAYYVFFGNRHLRRRKVLQRELNKAQDRVQELEELLLEAEANPDYHTDDEKKIRIFMDGAFDLMHYGHMNAFRRARSLGNYLVVGVNSDESIKQCKGPPVLTEEERMISVSGCKFVDEVVPNCPYVMSEDYLDWVIKTYNIDYVVHGDDPCIVNGKDVYESAKKRGKFKEIRRTEGVSTTDIVGRMLLMSTSHHQQGGLGESGHLVSTNKKDPSGEGKAMASYSKFLTTSRMLRLFSAGVKAPPKGAKIVYIDGAWDMFHAGHVMLFKKAREFGDYLVVGVHGDEAVNRQRGSFFPIMNLNERVLSVLGCVHVDDVLIDAPLIITREMIASLNICAVVHGTVNDGLDGRSTPKAGHAHAFTYEESYEVPTQMGIFHKIDSSIDLTLLGVMTRIQKQQDMFTKKISKKKRAENEYYNNLYNLNGSKEPDSK
uniref:ethanolamine-phosphate cytidylyltransferase n=1 Tax=Fibrocapsa japonica TaxID=94617 RepID=A0A7S2V0A7_9STRA|mmetsp:Transcript_21904/g.31809  ORF Transcript_21904/g.31809 Transcript_21904/m.31809 type:complete len:502 (+) Transcript_21904:209-1714(+)|eukprot:CAMPEP_0113939940 /NCGR_PEP_ID=MMETSP1339-20121228/6153_1 /TAXON_ID=94617 /ORGANISM="Fibrocapsa japonica" /LENGTH=501 /DNA_ID=CAMNT_0000943589 /DNA_START=121 /DNA_END=1626 /DNA_ORIENTATION=+ /assembly_acc=CAM_ASM_000762